MRAAVAMDVLLFSPETLVPIPTITGSQPFQFEHIAGVDITVEASGEPSKTITSPGQSLFVSLPAGSARFTASRDRVRCEWPGQLAGAFLPVDARDTLELPVLPGHVHPSGFVCFWDQDAGLP